MTAALYNLATPQPSDKLVLWCFHALSRDGQQVEEAHVIERLMADYDMTEEDALMAIIGAQLRGLIGSAHALAR